MDSVMSQTVTDAGRASKETECDIAGAARHIRRCRPRGASQSIIAVFQTRWTFTSSSRSSRHSARRRGKRRHGPARPCPLRPRCEAEMGFLGRVTGHVTCPSVVSRPDASPKARRAPHLSAARAQHATNGTKMPELPEVETARRGLEPHLRGGSSPGPRPAARICAGRCRPIWCRC